jgi:hypothetical protein
VEGEEGREVRFFKEVVAVAAQIQLMYTMLAGALTDEISPGT